MTASSVTWKIPNGQKANSNLSSMDTFTNLYNGNFPPLVTKAYKMQRKKPQWWEANLLILWGINSLLHHFYFHPLFPEFECTGFIWNNSYIVYQLIAQTLSCRTASYTHQVGSPTWNINQIFTGQRTIFVFLTMREGKIHKFSNLQFVK